MLSLDFSATYPLPATCTDLVFHPLFLLSFPGLLWRLHIAPVDSSSPSSAPTSSSGHLLDRPSSLASPSSRPRRECILRPVSSTRVRPFLSTDSPSEHGLRSSTSLRLWSVGWQSAQVCPSFSSLFLVKSMAMVHLCILKIAILTVGSLSRHLPSRADSRSRSPRAPTLDERSLFVSWSSQVASEWN